MIPNPGQMLSHYRLVEKISEGGMGVVWKAEDTILGRTVAIKVLRAGAARDEQRRKMFLDEARLASSVSEAHIVQVHEFAREGDLDFIVMEYVDGKPLSKILHGRPLPPDKVVSMGLQAARALSRAHRKGLLHRDLKPANILVTHDGDLKVVDFGLAMLFERRLTSAGSDETTRSAEGEPAAGSRPMPQAGTLPYMSPEQVRSEKLDARSDVFSLGVVLYEMTTGQRPFAGATHGELVQEILQGRPRPIHELVPKVPLELDRITQKALATKPGDRYQTMEDMAVDLKRLGRDLESGSSPSWDDLKKALAPERRRRLLRAGLAAALVLGAAGVLAWLTRDRWGAARPDPDTVLVLPMEVRGQTEGADYIGRAFAEAIAINLARAKGLHVLPVPAGIPDASGGPLTSNRASTAAGAARFLIGAVTRRDRAVLASLSLIDATRNRILWGAQKDSAEGDLPTLASSLAREAAAAMGAVLPRQYDSMSNMTGGPAMSASPLTSQALGALLVDDLKSILEATARLVESFPDEPEAWALRANALSSRWQSDPSPSHTKTFEDSLAVLDRLDPKNPYTTGFRALLDMSGAGRHREAIDRLTPLLSRNDLSPTIRAWILRQRAAAESNTGDLAAALADLKQAIELDPAAAHTYAVLGAVLRDSGRPEDCVVRARQAIALRPFFWRHHLQLALCLDDLGRHQEALIHVAKACDLSHAQSACATYAITLHKTGQLTKARSVAEQAAGLTDSIYGCYNLACYWALAGSRREALRFLRRAHDLGYSEPWIGRDPDLASLRGDPEFEAIVAEIRRRIRVAGGGGAPRD